MISFKVPKRVQCVTGEPWGTHVSYLTIEFRRNRLSFKESNCDISQLSAVVRLLSHRFTERHFEPDDSDEDDEPSDCRPS